MGPGCWGAESSAWLVEIMSQSCPATRTVCLGTTSLFYSSLRFSSLVISPPPVLTWRSQTELGESCGCKHRLGSMSLAHVTEHRKAGNSEGWKDTQLMNDPPQWCVKAWYRVALCWYWCCSWDYWFLWRLTLCSKVL